MVSSDYRDAKQSNFRETRPDLSARTAALNAAAAAAAATSFRRVMAARAIRYPRASIRGEKRHRHLPPNDYYFPNKLTGA